MAIQSIRQKDGSQSYNVYVVVRSPEDRELRVQKRKLGIKTIAEAKRAEAQLKREAERELFSREQKGKSWEHLIAEWLTAFERGEILGKISKTTAEDYTTALRLYTSHWNKRPAEAIHKADVIQVIREMEGQGRSKGRIQCVLIAINQIFRWGIDNRLIKGVTQSPATGLMLKRDEEKEPEILSLAQIKRLLDMAKLYDHPWHPVWSMALLTGMRSGELHELQWKDVDFDSRIIRVSRSWNSRLRTTKCTKAGYWRDVPINDDLMLLLKELKLQTGHTAWVLPRFHDWTRGTTAGILRKFCLSIGIPSVKFHTLRACFATHLLKNSVAPAVVMKICGWKDLKTMQRYIRLAGIEIGGATDSLSFLTTRETMGRVVQLFGSEAKV